MLLAHKNRHGRTTKFGPHQLLFDTETKDLVLWCNSNVATTGNVSINRKGLNDFATLKVGNTKKVLLQNYLEERNTILLSQLPKNMKLRPDPNGDPDGAYFLVDMKGQPIGTIQHPDQPSLDVFPEVDKPANGNGKQPFAKQDITAPDWESMLHNMHYPNDIENFSNPGVSRIMRHPWLRANVEELRFNLKTGEITACGVVSYST
jgi:hypothetical protein